MDWWIFSIGPRTRVSYENFLVFFQDWKFLIGLADVGVSEIVESISLLEIVEFVEFAEIVENCGIVVKPRFRNFNRGLGVPARIECADALYSSEENKTFGRGRFLVTCNMFEQV